MSRNVKAESVQLMGTEGPGKFNNGQTFAAIISVSLLPQHSKHILVFTYAPLLYVLGSLGLYLDCCPSKKHIFISAESTVYA